MRLPYIRLQAKNLLRNAVGSLAYGSDRAFIKPSGVFVDITYRCVLKCRMCYRWRHKGQEGELPLEAWKEIVLALKAWLGRYTLTLGGGEPLLKEGVLELIRFAHDAGIESALISNGYLIDEDLFEKLLDAGLGCLCLSVDGTDPETHDSSRGMPGSFERVAKVVELYSHRRPPEMNLSFSTILMGSSIDQMPGLVQWAEAKGVHSVNFQALLSPLSFPFTTDDRLDLHGLAEEHDFAGLTRPPEGARSVDAVMEELIDMRRSGRVVINNSVEHLRALRAYLVDPGSPSEVRCRTGQINLFVDPAGNARLCPLMPPVGSLHGTHPGRIWNSPEARTTRARIRACGEPCRLAHCNFPNLQLTRSLRRVVQQRIESLSAPHRDR